ncbi:MAG: YraN family protein [Chloroflexota bacterium]
MSKQSLGTHGETLATAYLEDNQYIIIERNWHCQRGEIDIIAQDTQTGEWVFCEVKTRRSTKTADAFASITPQKQAKMIASAQTYMHTHDLEDVAWRIDAIAVAIRPHQAPLIDHAKDALAW